MFIFSLSWIAPVVLRLLLMLADPFLSELPAGAIAAPVRAPDIVGKASRYGGPRDSRWGGAAMACAPDYRVVARMHVAAHRNLPCGTLLVVQAVATGRVTVVRVMDRGPFGALDPEGIWFPKVGRHRARSGVYRGELDLGFSAYNEIGLKGIGRIRAWKLWTPPAKHNPYKIRPVRRRRAVDI